MIAWLGVPGKVAHAYAGSSRSLCGRATLGAGTEERPDGDRCKVCQPRAAAREAEALEPEVAPRSAPPLRGAAEVVAAEEVDGAEELRRHLVWLATAIEGAATSDVVPLIRERRLTLEMLGAVEAVDEPEEVDSVSSIARARAARRAAPDLVAAP